MRFGLALPHYDFSMPQDGAPVSFAAVARVAADAERLGFDSVWLSDHFLYTFARYGAPEPLHGSLEPLTALAGVAALTERVRLGTLVLGAPFRHPSLLAKTVSTLDSISGGRIDLGIGAGWFQDEFTAFGYRYGSVGDRFASLEEALQVLEALLGGDEASGTFGGVELKSARLLPPPVQRPRPPVWVGGKGGPRLLRLAARHADGWNVVWRMSPRAYAGKVDDVAAACEAEGRDPATFRRTVGLYGLIAPDDASVAALWERARASMPGRSLDGESWNDWRADTLSGTPEQVLDRVTAFEAMGVEELILSPWVLPFALPEPEMLELVAERVIAPLR
jgi:probable F420-dependent oxidoreductase